MLASEIGRGYTDLCAALCAIGLGAAALQIWKEVDGILTADPARVPGARRIPHMSFDEAAALTRHGSEVVHSLAIQQIMAAPTAIALCICNVKHPAAPGTMVVREGGKAEQSSSHDSDTDCASLKSCVTFCRAITVQNDVGALHVRRKPMSCLCLRVAAFREPTRVEFTATSISRFSSCSYPKKWRMFSLSSAKRLLGKSASVQSASIITLICTRAEGNCRLASQVLAILKIEGINSTLIPQGEHGYTV